MLFEVLLEGFYRNLGKKYAQNFFSICEKISCLDFQFPSYLVNFQNIPHNFKTNEKVGISEEDIIHSYIAHDLNPTGPCYGLEPSRAGLSKF